LKEEFDVGSTGCKRSNLREENSRSPCKDEVSDPTESGTRFVIGFFASESQRQSERNQVANPLKFGRLEKEDSSLRV